MGWEYSSKAWVTMLYVSKIGKKSKTSGCKGREVEFLEEENVRHFAPTVNSFQGFFLDNFQFI